MRIQNLLIALAATLVCSQHTFADEIVWDWSPEAFPEGLPDFQLHAGAVNKASSQNFAEQVQFPQDTLITGMDIYTDTRNGEIGDSVTIRIREDLNGIPGESLHEFVEIIREIDGNYPTTGTLTTGERIYANRKFASFSVPIALKANTTYWIGMSGTDKDIRQCLWELMPPPGDQFIAQFWGRDFEQLNDHWDQVFRLHGQPAAINVAIDIKPSSYPNSINLCSNGAVPIAILGSDTFYVSDVNTESLRFAEAAIKVVGKKDPHTLCSYEDVNGDTIEDLVCHYVTSDIAGIDGESTTATVNGELLPEFGSTPFEGSDSVNIIKDTCY